jgi:hypothetical protein
MRAMALTARASHPHRGSPTAVPVVRDGVATVLRVLFVAYVVATAVHIGLVMAHEPFAFDAWNIAIDTDAQPFSLTRFLSYGAFEYAHSNPRIGQWLTYLAYKLEYFAPIATPIAFLGLAGAITVLGLGRWPGRRRQGGERAVGRDLALCAIAIGFAWFALPRIGMIMFCRAYGANYLYGAAIQLWFLVPLRLRPDGQGSRRACIAYFVLGVIAGMCNEHTGPTLVLFALGYAAWQGRARGARPQLIWAGALGCLVGFAAIFFAPGQDSRYEGLATKVSLVGRLLARGITGNLDILRDWMLACAPVLGLIVIALVIDRSAIDRNGGARRDEPARHGGPLRLVGLALAAGTLVAATVFVSPKLGPRFYLHGAALVLAGFIAVADHTLASARRLAPFVVLAIAASVYAGVRSLPLYYRLSHASAERLAALAAAPRGSVFTAESFEQVDDSWWFLGDDFRDVKKRELVASYFDLRGVIFRAVDIDAPLGVSDVRLVPRYQVTPASCLDEHGGLELGSYRGIDIGSVHKAAQAAIERLRQQIAPAGRLDRLDLVVAFTGATPVLPRPTLVVARWLPTGFEAHAGAIERRGSSTTRAVVLPPALRGTDLEIFAYQVNGEARRLGTARDTALEYVPWKRGAYWALACSPTECFVIAAARVL